MEENLNQNPVMFTVAIRDQDTCGTKIQLKTGNTGICTV